MQLIESPGVDLGASGTWALIKIEHCKINIWQHSTVFTEREKSWARIKSELNYKNVQKLWPQCCKFLQGYIIKKITQTPEFFEEVKEKYEDEEYWQGPTQTVAQLPGATDLGGSK